MTAIAVTLDALLRSPNFEFTVVDEEDSPTLETQLKKLTEENQKLEETVTGLMKTIEDMTTQIRKMDATAKSNTMLISKLKKKLGSFLLSCHLYSLEYIFCAMKFFMIPRFFF